MQKVFSFSNNTEKKIEFCVLKPEMDKDYSALYHPRKRGGKDVRYNLALFSVYHREVWSRSS